MPLPDNMDEPAVKPPPPMPPSSPPGTPGASPNAEEDELTPEEGHKAMQYFKHGFKHHPVMKYCADKYAKECGGGGPQKFDGSGATFVPGGEGGPGGAGDAASMPPKKPGETPEEEPMRMERDNELTLQYARMQIDMVELKQQNKALQDQLAEQNKEIVAINYEKKRVEAEAEADALSRGGWELNPDFVTELVKSPKDSWPAMTEKVKRYHKNTRNGAPTGGPRIVESTRVDERGKPVEYSREFHNRARQYCLDHGIDDYTAGLRELAEKDAKAAS
jgi:hypothetical protein